MSDFALTEAVINFAAGTEVNWNGFQLPIPANMVVYTIDTKKFKRGDGYRKYSELPDGPSIAGIIAGDQSSSSLLEQLAPGDDDGVIVIENEKYVASETKLSTLISRLTAVANGDTVQTADLATIGSQFGLANTNITVGDNDKLAITNNSKMSVGPTQSSFISLAPIPVIAIKDVTFYSDAKCTVKVTDLTANQTYYAKIECIHDTADVDDITFSLTDNSALTTITAIGRGIYKIVIGHTITDTPSIFTANATYNADTSSITKTVSIGKDRTVIYNLYAGNGEDRFQVMCFDPSGNIICCGASTTGTYGSGDCHIVKYDSNLNILAKKQYGGTGNEWITDVACDSNGNVFFVGSTYTASYGDNDCFIVKLDNNLNMLAQKVVGGAGSEQFSGLAIDSGNNIYAVGISTSTTPGVEDGLIVKFDNALTVLAQKRYGSDTLHDNFNKVITDSSNNIYVIGRVTEGAGGYDGLIMKLDSNLNILARKIYGGSGYEDLYGIALSSTNHLYIVGHTASEGIDIDALILKLDTNLTMLAKKRIGGNGVDSFSSVRVNAAGTEVICSGGSTSEYSDNACLIYKFDSNLNLTSKKQINSTGQDSFSCILMNSAGNVYACGYVGGYAVDGVILKFPYNIPAGTFEIIPDINVNLSDSYLAINESNLTYANSALTLNTSALSNAAGTINLYNANVSYNRGSVNL